MTLLGQISPRQIGRFHVNASFEGCGMGGIEVEICTVLLGGRRGIPSLGKAGKTVRELTA